MIFCRNKNLYVMYTATMKYLKIGEKSVIVVSVATMTFQYGGYLIFKLKKLENRFGDPHFLLKIC